MGTTSTIARREFRSYFDSPVAYVVICVTLFALGLLVFNRQPDFWQANEATFERTLFDWLPFLLAGIAPIVTMRLLAEEKRSGTLEMLITLPVRDREVVLGKFLAAWGLMLVLLVSTAIYPLLMFYKPWSLGALDTGPVMSAYIGFALFTAAVTAIGLFVSALTESQIIALFITYAVLGFLMLIGTSLVVDELPPQAQWVVTFISFESRITPFVRGMINTRDVIYFLTVIIGCLTGSFWALERRKWA